MNKKISIKSDDPILRSLNFQQYQNVVERRVWVFQPLPVEKQSMELHTPWGEILTASPGDLIISEIDNPRDEWPVRADIFDETYIITRPGFCAKKSTVDLFPLVELADGDEDAEVNVESLEGLITVRAGDFFLARGVKGEIWPYPKDKVEKVLSLVKK
jgi:hypothetical protein